MKRFWGFHEGRLDLKPAVHREDISALDGALFVPETDDRVALPECPLSMRMVVVLS
jgi:hypothetical protein